MSKDVFFVFGASPFLHLSGTGTATKGVNVKEIEGRNVVVVPEWSG